MKRPVMKPIWEDIVPCEADYCEVEITMVKYFGPMSELEIFFEIVPFDENDSRGAIIKRRLSLSGAYIFDQPMFEELVIGQSLKRIHVYPEIVRLDIITTGALLRVECDSYTIDNLEN